MISRLTPLCAIGLLMLCACQITPDPATPAAEHAIRLNQVGFLPDGPKLAIVATPVAYDTFAVQLLDGTVVYRDALPRPRYSPSTGEEVQVADFTAWTTPGAYRLVVEGLGASHPFAVADSVYDGVARLAAKALYFNRASTALTEAHAGPWARTAGHPDTAVVVHPSAADADRPAGTRIAAPGGWYDAGDYNKYIVPAAFTSYFLLAAYEDTPEAVAALDLNLPTSDDAVPDVLDEALWNLRWMLTMQAPDGGVYHKLTHAGFSDMVMPDSATTPRYVVQKTTAATLTFAAALAQAARVFAAFPDALPGLADSCRTAAERAWIWAQANSDVRYQQDSLNVAFDPDITTGAYGDETLEDEWYWAGIELYLATEGTTYYPEARPRDVQPPAWQDVALLGDMSMARRVAPGTTAIPHHRYLQQVAEDAQSVERTSAYRMALERDRDFYWGATGTAAAQAGVLMLVYRQTGEAAYRASAIHLLDYLLGRNGTTYSFVTGLGDHTPLHPHHRPSYADTIAAPVPGWLVGGPGAVGVEDCPDYPSDLPARHYLDDVCSYSTNEVTTYWNAPLVHAALLLDAFP